MINGRKKNFCKSKKKAGKGEKPQGIRKNRLLNKITIISSLFFLLVGAVLSGTALFTETVYALPPTLLKAKTIAELILTLAAGAGTGLSGPVAVPAIYSSYDVSIEQLVQNDVLNLINSPDATDEEIINALGSGQQFTLDVSEYRDLMSVDWQTMRDAGLDASLHWSDLWSEDPTYGAIDNLGSILCDVCQIGYVQGEMTIRNLTNPETAIQVRLEDIGTGLKSYWHGTMLSGVKLNPPTNYRENYLVSQGKYGAQIGNYWESNNIVNDSMFYDPLHCFLVGRNGGTVYRLYNINMDPFTTSYLGSGYTDRQSSSNWISYTWPGGKPDNPDSSAVKFGQNLITWFNTWDEADNYVNSIKSGGAVYNPKLPYSPDIINQDEGYLNTYNENDADSPLGETDRMDIVDGADYVDMVQNLQEEDPSDVAPIYDDFIQPYINQEYVEPELPLPTYAPVRPVEPEQPTLPEKDEVTSEDQEKALTYATPGLEEVFPFCIPFDVWKMLRTLTAEREAPVFEFPLVIESQGINEIVTVDLSLFDTVATILRILELILFTVGLAIATRRLIGA